MTYVSVVKYLPQVAVFVVRLHVVTVDEMAVVKLVVDVHEYKLLMKTQSSNRRENLVYCK